MSENGGMHMPEALAARLRDQVLNQVALGEKLPSARKLATRFGVSVNTLRAAQAILMHEGFLAGHPRSAVRLCRLPGCRRVGVLSELDVFAHTGGQFRDLVGHTLKALRARGMAPVFFCGTVQPDTVGDQITCPEFWSEVEQRRLDAAVIIDVPCTDAWFRRIQGLTIPAVGAFTSYEVDNHLSLVSPALRELRHQGAHRIALLTWQKARIVSAFESGLVELGLETRPRWIGGAFNPALPGSGWEAFREIWSAYGEKPDGLLVTDDVFFSGAAQAIRELGIAVPERLRVVTQSHPAYAPGTAPFPHTRMEVDPQESARILVGFLDRRLAGGTPPAAPVTVPYTVMRAGGDPRHPGCVGCLDRGNEEDGQEQDVVRQAEPVQVGVVRPAVKAGNRQEEWR